MGSLGRRKSFLIGALIAILALIIACGEEATPVPTPAGVSASEIQAIVSEAVGNMPAPDATGPSREEIASLVAQAVQASAGDNASPEQIQAMIQAAVGSIEPGVTPEQVAAVVNQAVEGAISAITPTAMPSAAPQPTMAMMQASGTLDFGVGDIGAEVYVLKNQAYQATVFDGRVTHEHMWGSDTDGNLTPRLVTGVSDTVNADGTWTRIFNLRRGAKWHTRYGDWGEFNAEDFMFTMENVAGEGSVHTNSGRIRDLFECDGCSMREIDDYTVELTRPRPTFQIEWWNTMPVGNTTLRSARHYAAMGDELASKQSVGTGPFQLVESLSDDFKRTEAVQDHWRKTPEFAEFVWHQLSEESTRYANYLTGVIDTGQFSPDSIQAIKGEARDEDDYLVFPGARLQYIHVHAQNYFPDHPSHGSEFLMGEGAAYTETCKVQAWVSCDRDVTSDEWARALKVRQALTMSIDRQSMVNNLAFGEAEPAYTFGFMGHASRSKQYGLDKLTWAYDPDLAKQMIAEAGYPDGFEIEMHLTSTGGIGVDTSGEVIGGMWRSIGLDVKHVVQPYSSFRPTIVARTAKGVRPDEQGVANEPLRYYATFYVANNVFNFGIEHPDLQALIDDANVTYDVEERWAKSADIAKWLHNNIVNIPLYEEGATWPLGPEIGKWGVSPLHIEWLNNWEYTPHR